MKKLLLLSLLAFAPFSLANADLKIAVIDLGKAFDAYYKTKDASAKIDAKKAAYTKDIQDEVQEFQHMQDDAKKLYDRSNDATLSAQARSEASSALNQKKQDLMSMQGKIEEMKNEDSNAVKDEIFRRHKEIVDEITAVVNAYSAPQGFDLVIDKSSASAASGIPIILYTSSKLIDITPDVITKLNAGAPAGGAAPAPAASAPTPATPAAH
jgi:Skp family chaperone for outer membrane proteins